MPENQKLLTPMTAEMMREISQLVCLDAGSAVELRAHADWLEQREKAMPTPAAPVEVEGMLPAIGRDVLRGKFQKVRVLGSTEIFSLFDSHDACERALREAQLVADAEANRAQLFAERLEVRSKQVAVLEAERAVALTAVRESNKLLLGAAAELDRGRQCVTDLEAKRDAALARETEGKQNYADMCEEWRRDLEDYRAKVKAVESERDAALARMDEIAGQCRLYLAAAQDLVNIRVKLQERITTLETALQKIRDCSCTGDQDCSNDGSSIAAEALAHQPEQAADTKEQG